jgi:hypothetical protein
VGYSNFFFFVLDVVHASLKLCLQDLYTFPVVKIVEEALRKCLLWFMTAVLSPYFHAPDAEFILPGMKQEFVI